MSGLRLMFSTFLNGINHLVKKFFKNHKNYLTLNLLLSKFKLLGGNELTVKILGILNIKKIHGIGTILKNLQNCTF